jgi:hypothetical protein
LDPQIRLLPLPNFGVNSGNNNGNQGGRNNNNYSAPNRKRKPDNTVAAIQRPAKENSKKTSGGFKDLLKEKCMWHLIFQVRDATSVLLEGQQTLLLELVHGILELLPLFRREVFNVDIHDVPNVRHLDFFGCGPTRRAKKCVDAKCAPSAKHTASRTSWLHSCKESQDVPINFS